MTKLRIIPNIERAHDRAVIAAMYAGDCDRRQSAGPNYDTLAHLVRLWPDGRIEVCRGAECNTVPESQYYEQAPYPVDVYHRGHQYDRIQPENSGLELLTESQYYARGYSQHNSESVEVDGEWMKLGTEWDMGRDCERAYTDILRDEFTNIIDLLPTAFYGSPSINANYFNECDLFEFRELTPEEQAFYEMWLAV